MVYKLALELETDIAAFGANVKKEVSRSGDGGVFGTLDFAKGVELFGSREVVGEFVPDGAADSHRAGQVSVGVSKGDIFG